MSYRTGWMIAVFASAMGLASLCLTASPADATTVDITYTGTIGSGSYYSQSFVAEYVLDTSAGSYHGYYASGSVTSAELIIDGSTTFTFEGYGGTFAYTGSAFGGYETQSDSGVNPNIYNYISTSNPLPSDLVTPFTYTVQSGDISESCWYDSSGNCNILFTDTVTAALAATPLPATLPLFAGGLGFVGYLTRRRKRSGKQALAAA